MIIAKEVNVVGYSYGRRWTEDEVEEEINSVKNILEIDRMPTSSEISLVTGSSSLNNKISKSILEISLQYCNKFLELYNNDRVQDIKDNLIIRLESEA